MPHLVLLYSANIETQTDISALCRTLCDTMLAQGDTTGKQLFPIGGTRVFAYPAPHYAIADGGAAARAAGDTGDYAFVYLRLRMSSGRDPSLVQATGDALLEKVKAHFASLFDTNKMGITLHIDEQMPSYEGKFNNLNALFI